MSESESRVTASNDNLAPKNVPAKGGNNKLVSSLEAKNTPSKTSSL